MSQNISKKEYLDTYLKEFPLILAFTFFLSAIFGNDDIVPLTRFPEFWSTEGETERDMYDRHRELSY